LNQARDILKYLGSYFPNDSPELLALEAAFELKTLKENKVQSSMAESKDLHRYVELLYAYHLALNNAENFTEERSRYLSEEAQAAFYLKQSVKCGINGDHASQVRILKKVLHLQNDLVDFVDILMKNLQNQIEQEENGSNVQVKAEFQALADRLKSVVSEFILKGDFQNARNVLDQLNQFLPGDPDIPKLFMLLKQ
jgi:hypothetical protein